MQNQLKILLDSEPFNYAEKRASLVYRELKSKLESSKNIFVGGITGVGGIHILGESAFLCKLFPDLIYVDDHKAGSQIYGRDVISTKDFVAQATAEDSLINNCLSVNGFNHFERLGNSLNLKSYSATLEVISAYYDQGVMPSFNGQLAVYGASFHKHSLENINIYRNLRGKFSDALSLRTFDNLILYRLSGNPSYLQQVGVGYNYGRIQHDSYMLNSQFFTLSDDEILIDAGALTGDSSEYFIRSVNGNFKKIIMFEPSLQSVYACHDRINKLDKEFIGKDIKRKTRIALSGLYSFTGEISFTLSLFDKDVTSSDGEMPQSAHIIETGLSEAFVKKGNEYKTIKVPVTTLDEFMGARPVTFIKFEIEGSEVDALNGAIKTIRRNAPKMALSIYHRPQDLELIINFVLELNMGYKIALRAHNPNCPDAIVLYCWIE